MSVCLCVLQVCTGPQEQCVVSSLIVSNLESATDLSLKMLHQSVEVPEIVTLNNNKNDVSECAESLQHKSMDSAGLGPTRSISLSTTNKLRS